MGVLRRSNVRIFKVPASTPDRSPDQPYADAREEGTQVAPAVNEERTRRDEQWPEAEVSEEAPQNPLLKKIRETLAHSDPARWIRAGDLFDKNARHRQPRDHWERLYGLETPAGTLVLRESTPVQAKYVGGGYQYTPQSAPLYTVELRAKGWNPRELVDPDYRAQAKGGTKCDVLVSDRTARELFGEIDTAVRNHVHQGERAFRERIDALVVELPTRIAATRLEQWRVDEPESNIVRYCTALDGITVEVFQRSVRGSHDYGLRFHADGFCISRGSASFAREIFQQIINLGENARLSFLNEMLESSLGTGKK